MQTWTTDCSDGYQKNVVEFYLKMKPLIQCLKREGLKTLQGNICFNYFFWLLLLLPLLPKTLKLTQAQHKLAQYL